MCVEGSKSAEVERKSSEAERVYAAQLTLLQQKLQEETEKRCCTIQWHIITQYCLCVCVCVCVYCVYTVHTCSMYIPVTCVQEETEMRCYTTLCLHY